eukprot:CAMPEP_0201476434 /NCGR_PEP_ID=MMETSP0151_2-20130828/1632_1 /ASSEMBLY_ACC=CAM_ASM_000257 /TAXON_ID=200890 /ORGANISM="Paramoeba atlantica, Strain 621/1 / CCAP 1560/9" /LENGTH=192 /DNA_ID=CAMNT_0047856787 /DNA_START=100 /DNA_END=678 /DNA_ORIENTATION=+
MFGLLSGLWDYAFTKHEMFVLIIGLEEAGKTTFLEKLKGIYKGQRNAKPPPTSPTVGLNIARVDAGPIKLTFWDLGGQQGLRSIWQKYMKDASACVFVVDATSTKERIEEARQTLKWVLEDPNMGRIPLLVVANKQDIPGSRLPPELARDLRLEEFQMPLHAVQAMCAVQGNGVEEGMSWLVDQVLLISSSK